MPLIWPITRGGVRSALLALTPLIAGTATAQEAGLDLVVRGAADGCLAARALLPRIAYYRGAVAPRAAQLQLELVVDGTQRAELRILAAEAELSHRSYRNLPAACSERRDAVALSIALSVENALQALESPGPSAPGPGVAAEQPASAAAADGEQSVAEASATDAEPEPPAPARSDDQPAPRMPALEPAPPSAEAQAAPQVSASPAQTDGAPAPSSASAAGTGLRLYLGGRWLAGALPAPVWLGALGVELRLTRRLTLGVSGFVSSASEREHASGRARSWLGGAELSGCATWPLGSLDLQLCAAPTLALCRARGLDYPGEVPASSVAWAALGARVALRWPSSGPLSLRVLAQWQLSVLRPELEVEGETARLHAPWFGGLLGAELGFALE